MEEVLGAAALGVDGEGEPPARQEGLAHPPALGPEGDHRGDEDAAVLDAGDLDVGDEEPGGGLGGVVVLDDDEAVRAVDEGAALAGRVGEAGAHGAVEPEGAGVGLGGRGAGGEEREREEALHGMRGR